ncbi:MAG TPA: penicillin-binding transpeptidase domain-containing protein [Jatrophihabitans sp.]|nr:penicillin-binding transpeptidase domain-containing protein [Jatrophihabitans sp.]
MNRPIRKVTIAFAVLFIALFVNLNVVQVVRGSSYRDDPQNRRVLLNEYATPRGAIVVQGSNVAESVKTPDELKYKRVYPNPNGPVYAPATGFYSFTYGSSGIEQAENSVLSGDSPKLFTTKLAGLLTGRDPRGGSVQLTLNAAAQKAAYQAMQVSKGKFKRGAVVALDPSTGAVLAMVSTPSYDPNQLSSHDADAISRAYNCYSALNSDRRAGETQAQYRARIDAQIAARKKSCAGLPEDPTAMFAADPTADSPMLNKAINQNYPAGSIFKIIDSAAALRLGVTPSTSLSSPNAYWPYEPNRTTPCPRSLNAACIENFEGEACDNGKAAQLSFAFAKSCNTTFAKLVVEKVGAQRLVEQGKLFGLDTDQLKIPLAVSQSTIGSPAELRRDRGALAQTAIGQRSVRVTPLQAAMMSAAVANNGTLMEPYLVKSELRPNLSVLQRTQPSQLTQVIDPDLDRELANMMIGVVQNPQGTGGPARIPELEPTVQIGGKTGTADVGATSASKVAPDAWFTGFATVRGTAKIAVAVVIENGGVQGNEATGGLAAGPVAKKVIAAYLKSIGVS